VGIFAPVVHNNDDSVCDEEDDIDDDVVVAEIKGKDTKTFKAITEIKTTIIIKAKLDRFMLKPISLISLI
jgi:hypothetical protein